MGVSAVQAICFYTNRVPAVEMHKQILNTGFTLLSQSFGRWPELPILRSDLDMEFQRYSDQELLFARLTSLYSKSNLN